MRRSFRQLEFKSKGSSLSAITNHISPDKKMIRSRTGNPQMCEKGPLCSSSVFETDKSMREHEDCKSSECSKSESSRS